MLKENIMDLINNAEGRHAAENARLINNNNLRTCPECDDGNYRGKGDNCGKKP